LRKGSLQLQDFRLLTVHFRMARKAKQHKSKSRKSNLLLAVVVAIALLLLLLRMINFVAGHGHHRL
jgi:hypothetical protein